MVNATPNAAKIHPATIVSRTPAGARRVMRLYIPFSRHCCSLVANKMALTTSNTPGYDQAGTCTKQRRSVRDACTKQYDFFSSEHFVLFTFRVYFIFSPAAILILVASTYGIIVNVWAPILIRQKVF